MRYFRYFPKVAYDLDDNKTTRDIVDVFRMGRVVSTITDDISFYRNYTIQEGERPDHASMTIYGSQEYYWTFFIINEHLKNSYTDWPRTRDEVEEWINDNYTDEYIKYTNYDLAEKFTIGETLQGLISGATAIVTEKNTDLGWIRVKDRTGTFQTNELFRGLTSLETGTIEGTGAFKFAAHHYEKDGYIVNRDTPLAAMVSNYDYEIEENESKRDIRVIRPEFITKVKRQFREAING